MKYFKLNHTDEEKLSRNDRLQTRSMLNTIVMAILLAIVSLDARAQTITFPAYGSIPSTQEEAQTQQGGLDFSVTYGLKQLFRSRDDKTGPKVLVGPFNFKLYATPWLTITVGQNTFKSSEVPGEKRITGTGDTSLAVDVVLVGDEPCTQKNAAGEIERKPDCTQHPGFGLSYYTKFPTASNTKMGRVDHSILGVISKGIGTTRNSIEVDFGMYFAGKSDSSGYYNIGQLTLIFSRTLDQANRWSFFTEVDSTTRTEEIPSEIYNVTGLGYNLTDHVSVGGGIIAGLTVNAPRFGFYGSLTLKGKIGASRK